MSLKLTSPDKNGLPEAFLRKLMAEFSGALVQSSKSRFQILNRNSTEEIWQEAVEFNNQDVAKITKSAGADVSVTLSPKINEKGIDLSVTAYSLKEESMGILLASASELIPMNVKAELGVDVKNLDKKIDELSKLIDKDKATQSNELSDLFFKFADGLDLNQAIRIYSNGCDKPVSLREQWKAHFNSSGFEEHYALFSNDPPINCKKPYGSEFFSNFQDGFNVKCEVYNEGELPILDNVELDKKIDIDIINGSRISIRMIRLGSKFPNRIMMPSKIDPYTKLLACRRDSVSTHYESLISVTLLGKRTFFVLDGRSGGAADSWGYLILSYDEESLLKENEGAKYVKPGDPLEESDRTCGG